MTNDAERVSDIVARLRGNALVTYLDNGLIATVPPSNAALLIEAADIIEAQSKALAEARVVKPLKWTGYGGDRWYTRTEVGTYCAGPSVASSKPGWFWYRGAGDAIVVAGEREAKAAAQADYEARILSALAAPSQPAAVGELEAAARDVVASRSDTYRAGNNRQVGIQDESGEKMWIVPFDEMAALEAALRSTP